MCLSGFNYSSVKLVTQKIDFSRVNHVEDSDRSMLSNVVEETATGNGLAPRNRPSFIKTCAFIKSVFNCCVLAFQPIPNTFRFKFEMVFLCIYFVHACHICTFEYGNNFGCVIFGKHARRTLNGNSTCSKY